VQQLIERSLPLVLLAWGSGVLVLSSRLTGGWAWLQFLRRRRETVPAGDEQQLMLLRLCQRMKLVSNIRLLRCDRVKGPTVLGWLKPVVLVPGFALTGLSPQQLELILAHELAHILRHDYAVNLIQSVVEVLFFYHPAVWWISAKIRQERELCCDALAVRHAGDALDYARALTHLETLSLEGAFPTPALALSATGGSFMHRIQRLISPTTPTPLAHRAGVFLLLLLGCALTLQARLNPAAAAPKPAPTATELPAGAIRLRRYDADSKDGLVKAGSIDMEAKGVDVPSMEQAFARLAQLPQDVAKGYVDLVADTTPATHDAFTYRFHGAQPAWVLLTIRAWSTFPFIEEKDKQPGALIVQRTNAARCDEAVSECNSAVPASHGISDAFSTGSQNQ